MFDNSNISPIELEKLEHKYLMKYWYFLKFVEDEIVSGINSMEKIRDNWEGLYGGNGGTSEFDVGCERIVYALLNGKIAGQPNSSPVSSDLFFEVNDAFIHIDLKSVQTTDNGQHDNINDFNKSIFVGENQNSYIGEIIKQGGNVEKYHPNLPHFYTVKENGNIIAKKITLTYFVCLLNNADTHKCELCSIMCFPNGKLESIYHSDPLKAGKNPGKARFNFSKVPTFRCLGEEYKRVRIIYKNQDMSEHLKEKLQFYLSNFDPIISK